jgi:hypothetical protein
MAQIRAPKTRIYNLEQDVLIIFWVGLIQDLLPVLDYVLDLLDRDPMRQEPARNYRILVKDSTGEYNGLLPLSGVIGNNIRQLYGIAWFHEDDEHRALTKVKHAYDKGLDTNPLI